MTRGKKKESALTPEEKLAQALVPDWEQPYKVPENWCWTTIGAINQYSGGSIDPLKEPDSWFELYSVPSSADNYPEIVQGFEIGSTKQEVQKNDVLLCKINPRINRVWSVSQHTGNKLLGSSEWIVVRNPKIDSQYLMWCFQTRYFREFMLSNVSGVGGSLMRAQPKYVQGYPIPIAPLAEQKRIVDRIESLFARMDEAKEKAQFVLDSFETRKAAILHKAFTGELTANWRSEHVLVSSGWYESTIGDLFEVFSGKGFKEKEYSLSGIKLLRISNVTYDELVWDDTKYLPLNYLDTVPELVLQSGDIVMALNRPITNGKLKVSIVDDRESYILYQRVGCLRKRNPENSTQYLQYALLSQSFLHQVESHLQGSDQPYINLPPLKSLTISMCSEHEQKEIVRILDSLFAKERQAKEAAEAVLEKIDLLKKSILARAFRGELGTNDSTEESAVELLKSILGRPDEPKTTVKRTFIPKDLDDRIKTELERKIIKLYIQQDVVSMTIDRLMAVSSKKFDVMEALRNLQQRGILVKENDMYKLLR